jgi:hypothetical protein
MSTISQSSKGASLSLMKKKERAKRHKTQDRNQLPIVQSGLIANMNNTNIQVENTHPPITNNNNIHKTGNNHIPSYNVTNSTILNKEQISIILNKVQTRAISRLNKVHMEEESAGDHEMHVEYSRCVCVGQLISCDYFSVNNTIHPMDPVQSVTRTRKSSKTTHKNEGDISAETR